MTQEDVLVQADRAARKQESGAPAQTEKYLLFESDGLLFGVPAGAVVEIITGHPVTGLPLVPPYIRGIINLRGHILPIVDIRRMLDHGNCESSCIIILQTNDTEVGILVDGVQKMVDIDASALLPVPPRSSQELVCGMYSLEDGQTMLAFDCVRLLERS